MSLDLFETVASLIDQSMLLRLEASGEPRFGMLETIQEYGTDHLTAEGEEPAVRRAHASYYLALAEQAEPHLRGPEQSAWLERLESEQGNIRAALRRLLDDGQPEAALRLGGSLGRFWYVRGHLAEGRRWLEEALEYGGADPAERARALRIAAMLANYWAISIAPRRSPRRGSRSRASGGTSAGSPARWRPSRSLRAQGGATTRAAARTRRASRSCAVSATTRSSPRYSRG